MRPRVIATPMRKNSWSGPSATPNPSPKAKVMNVCSKIALDGVHPREPPPQRSRPPHREEHTCRRVRRGDRDRENGVDNRKEHYDPSHSPQPVRKQENRIFRGVYEGVQVVRTPPDEQRPGGKDVEGTHD